MDSPQLRANWAKFTVRCAKRAAQPLQSTLLRAIPSELRAEIREAGPLDWLPARVFVELCESIRSGVGSVSARAFWRQSLRDAIRQPFIQPLARGALFLWGKTPTSLVRRTPQAWQLVSRHCGELKAIESGDEDTITLRVEQLPAVCRRQGLLLMWEGGLMAQLDTVDAEGSVTVRSEQFSTLGTADFCASVEARLMLVRARAWHRCGSRVAVVAHRSGLAGDETEPPRVYREPHEQEPVRRSSA